MKKFKVGKCYRFIDYSARPDGVEISGDSFVCHSIDSSGDAWSRDAAFHNQSGNRFCSLYHCYGWNVACVKDLNLGLVVEVKDK